jgi:hypothetical protein
MNHVELFLRIRAEKARREAAEVEAHRAQSTARSAPTPQDKEN